MTLKSPKGAKMKKLNFIFIVLIFFITSSLIFAKFGLDPDGTINSFNPYNKKLIALTFDACSGKYDKELIDFLIKNKIKATLFISGRWIDKNADVLKKLAKNPLFEIENHGLTHRPLSIDCKSAYGIKGTCSKKEVVDEILKEEAKIYRVTGIKTKYFRSGTAHYDTEAIKIANRLGYKVIGFTVNGDFGATADVKTIYKQVTNAKPGSIILAHMNHPEKNTFEGFKPALLYLKRKGFQFVKLEDVLK